jgi:hypothetical protein
MFSPTRTPQTKQSKPDLIIALSEAKSKTNKNSLLGANSFSSFGDNTCTKTTHNSKISFQSKNLLQKSTLIDDPEPEPDSPRDNTPTTVKPLVQSVLSPSDNQLSQFRNTFETCETAQARYTEPITRNTVQMTRTNLTNNEEAKQLLRTAQ